MKKINTKNKFIALMLIAVMLFAVMPTMASATSESAGAAGWNKLINSPDVRKISDTLFTYENFSLVIDYEILVPEGVQLYLMPYSGITLTKKFEVAGVVYAEGMIQASWLMSTIGRGQIFGRNKPSLTSPGSSDNPLNLGSPVYPDDTAYMGYPDCPLYPGNAAYIYYCPSCPGGYHYYTDMTSPCVIINNGGMPVIPGYNQNYDQYYNHNYVYMPGYGWIATDVTCAAPTSGISGGVVDAETKVSLATITPGAVIYYTINGTAPNASSIKYTEPISITKNITIHAIAVHPYIYSSPVAKFEYKVKVSAAESSYKDISSYPGLAASLDKLIAKKVISTSAAFNPSEKISWNELSAWFTDLGVDVSKADIKSETAFADANELTYEEMILTCYKIMRADKLIAAPRNQGSVTIKKLTYSTDITTTAIYKAAYASLIEDKVLYALNFKPQDPANRAYLATAVAWASSKVK